MNYLQASRGFAFVAQLLRHCDIETQQDREEFIGLIECEIRHRLNIRQDRRIPWTTSLSENEMQIFSRFSEWVDTKTQQPQHLQNLRARIVSVNRMLGTLSDRIPSGLISLIRLEFFADVVDIHHHLEAQGIVCGLANKEAKFFPEDADQMLAALIDKMEELGISLGN